MSKKFINTKTNKLLREFNGFQSCDSVMVWKLCSCNTLAVRNAYVLSQETTVEG